MSVPKTSPLCAGKSGYEMRAHFRARTRRALAEARAGKEDFWRYEAVNLHTSLSWYASVVPILGALRGYTILDVGCGYGQLSSWLAAFDCAAYVGVDSEPLRVEFARRTYDWSRCSFQVGDARYLDLGRKFDVVFCCTVIQHMVWPDKVRVLEAMKRHRAPGGALLMREGRLRDAPLADLETEYQRGGAANMIPAPLSEVARVLAPLRVRSIGNQLYVAEE